MDREQVKAWKAGMEEVNRLTLEEARARTPAECVEASAKLVDWLRQTGRLQPRSDDLEYHLRWQRLRERWIARRAA